MLRVGTRNAPHGHENVDLLTCPLPQVGFDSDSVHGNYSTVHALETKHQCFSLALVPTLRVGTYTAATHDRPYAFPRRAWERKCSVWERETRRVETRTPVCSHAHCRRLGLTATLFMATIATVHALETKHQCFSLALVPTLRVGTYTAATHDRPYAFPRRAWERKCSVWKRETRRVGMRTSVCSHAHCRRLGLTATLFMATIQRFTHLRRSANVSALHSFPRGAWERECFVWKQERRFAHAPIAAGWV